MGLGAGGRGDSRGNVVRHAAAEGFRSWQRAEGPAGQTGTLGWGGPALWVGPAPGGQGAWPCSSPAGRLADILRGGGVTETSQKRQKPHCHGEILL